MARTTKSEILVALLLALAIACAALAILAGNRRADHWGPRVLAVATDGNVWLMVDQELVIADTDGRLRQRIDLGKLDLPGPVNSLAPLPAVAGRPRMLAGVIGLPAWLVLDEYGQVTGRITPDAIDGDYTETFQLASSDDGRIAMAASGAHRVHTFDGNGHRLAESAAGLFRFANGLWHEGEQWWVVDTNHSRILALDDTTLAEQRRIAVPSVAAAAFPALARRNPTGDITVSLLHNGMDSGVVVDIDEQGNLLRRYALQAEDPKPVDFIWLADGLVVAERDGFALQLLASDGSYRRAWGDAGVTAVLDDARAQRRYWSRVLTAAQAAAGFFVFAGLLMYALWKQRRTASGAAAEAATAALATPSMPAVAEQLARLRVTWPALLPLLVVLGMFYLLTRQPDWLKALLGGLGGSVWRLPVTVLVGLIPLAMVMVGGAWTGRRLAEIMHRPEHEAIFSARWVRWWQQSGQAQAVLAAGERAREVLMVQPAGLFPALSFQVWVLTDRRLLVFRPGPGHDARLLAELPRGDCAANCAPADGWRLALGGRDRITVTGRDGRHFEGSVGSPVTAKRLAELLGRRSGIGTAWAHPSTQPARRSPEPVSAFLLSLLLPGLAQLLQERFQIGAVLLVGTALIFILAVAPVLLGWFGHYYDVTPATGAAILLPAAVWSVMAAVDAFGYARRAYRQDRVG